MEEPRGGVDFLAPDPLGLRLVAVTVPMTLPAGPGGSGEGNPETNSGGPGEGNPETISGGPGEGNPETISGGPGEGGPER